MGKAAEYYSSEMSIQALFFPSPMSLFFSSKINHSSSVSTVSSLSLPTVHQTRPLWHLSAMCCQLAKTSTLTTCDYSKAFSFTVTELLLNPECVISELLTYPTGLEKKKSVVIWHWLFDDSPTLWVPVRQCFFFCLNKQNIQNKRKLNSIFYIHL